MSNRNNREMLIKAAQCYVKAGWLADACRVWEEIGEYRQAAAIYEQQEKWSQAAQCYVKNQDWSKAAQCYLRNAQPEAAAECWTQAGDTLKAVWIRTDYLKQHYQTQLALRDITPQTATEELEIELILARCEAGARKTKQAAARLRQILSRFKNSHKKHLYEWALRVAEVLNRPDLSALIYSKAVKARMPNAIAEWETWAMATLGEATGIPQPEEEEEEDLNSFSFEVVTVNPRGEIINTENKQASYLIEDLGNGEKLEMVYIPAGSFLMGSPESERESDDRERPQHQVSIEAFWLGKYPVTQGQWRAVAKLPKVNRDLEPDPSEFKGENRPVEFVSWLEAVEFCDRVSKHTGIEYRLPSEGEWEYACRAGTTTPFHYGETLTSRLANYKASYTYGEEAVGKYRRETTEVGSFPPNGFGLYDMHGNVEEYCADSWHNNYERAPTDGSIWQYYNKYYYHSLRGGSWTFIPRDCRSASRLDYDARDDLYSFVGFRVARGVETS
ncbi:SUMF1/EgtB/PvdO family nonheme iron enzyme [Moorena producens JHB]|uniref:SUMF1/EgtB/PvdO family nonheme iron enzyme n=1 Tax=Moorena producens (strain JHB) TaxID=1454205 RepID=A0A9Q9UW74_MOOP1|nr:SUMF1/EgtB/PvdO family nonheme iron enzyme [Moorena producens]WAN69556.1 SUMF1/EgtB/PvdO family nonheme iron enzyme [Moorena producens JHB]